MSFILDALKKSDARRRRESTPGLHTPTPEPPRRRGGTARWIILVLLLAAAAGAAFYLSGWLSPATHHKQAEQNSTGTSSTALEEPGEHVSDSLTSLDAEKPERSLANAPRPDQSSVGDGKQADREETPERNRRSPRQRNISSRDASDDDRRRRRPEQARARESAPVPAEEAMDELKRRVKQESDSSGRTSQQPAPEQAEDGQVSDQSSRQPSAQSVAASSEAASKESAPRSVRRRAPQSEPASPGGVAEYVHAWELPLSVRRSIPELKLNIHVYAPEEERRFVLINGTRYGVGDSVDGAQIVAIRPEGAVMDFQSHRFLLEP